MRTDGLFTYHRHVEQVRLDQPIHLCPISDIHRDNELHAESEYQDWLRYATAERKRDLFIGLGDANDFARAHVRAFLGSSEHGKSVDDALQKQAKAHSDLVVTELRPIAKRFIGWMSGNHYFVFTDKQRGVETRTHSDEYIAGKLGCPYLGTMSRITITLQSGNKSADLRIIAHHGAGGGTTVAGGLNRVVRMMNGWEGVDIGLMGDNHQRGVVPLGEQLDVREQSGRERLTVKRRFAARTGSFLRGFEVGKSSYVVDACYDPTSIGTVEFELRLKTCPRTGHAYVSVRAIT